MAAHRVLLCLLIGLTLAGGPEIAAIARADAVGGELILLTTHLASQRDAPIENYERRLDDKGTHVRTPGLELYWDFDLAEPLWKARQIRVSGGVLSDSVTHRFFYFAVMGRWILWEGERFSGSLHLGPGLVARKSWRDIPGYDPDNPLTESDSFLRGYEHAFTLLGEVDLLYRFTPRLQGVWSIVPGIPYVLVQSIGLRWTFGAEPTARQESGASAP